ncbi:MAG: hypothetical protein PHX04_00835 [Bacilli bacterium]|nr:hypothetical protein [Bacilli bacterium]
MKFLKKIFNKKEEVIEEEFIEHNIPDLVSLDSNKIDLMAPQEIESNIIEETVTPIEKKVPEIEAQLIANSEIEAKKFLLNEEKFEAVNAFNMQPSKEAPNVEVLDIKLHKTQKFCPECATPNDILNKYCISCGYTFK